jgi:RNA polymerase sigma factor (sigma-70 family)
MTDSDQARWFAEEVQPHEPLLRAYLQKQFPALADVDDVVQESHLRLLKARERGPIASAKAYLFAIARNVAIGAFRKNRKIAGFPVNEIGGWDILEADTNVVESASLQQEVSLAAEAIDRLPGRCREIVVLRALHGLSHKEIAVQLGLSEQTVRVQVARGMKKCAQFLRERGVSRGLP